MNYLVRAGAAPPLSPCPCRVWGAGGGLGGSGGTAQPPRPYPRSLGLGAGGGFWGTPGGCWAHVGKGWGGGSWCLTPPGAHPGGAPGAGAASLLGTASDGARAGGGAMGLAAGAPHTPGPGSRSPQRAQRRVPGAKKPPALSSASLFPKEATARSPRALPPAPQVRPRHAHGTPTSAMGPGSTKGTGTQRGTSPGCTSPGATVLACPPLARQPVGNSPALAESRPWHFLPGGKGRERQRRSPKPGRRRVRPLPSTTSGKDGLNWSGEEEAAGGGRAARGGTRESLGVRSPLCQAPKRRWRNQGGFGIPG